MNIQNQIDGIRYYKGYQFTPWCLLECCHLVCLQCARDFFRRLIGINKIGCVISGCGYFYKCRPEARSGIKTMINDKECIVYGPRNENEKYEVNIHLLRTFVEWTALRTFHSYFYHK